MAHRDLMWKNRWKNSTTATITTSSSLLMVKNMIKYLCYLTVYHNVNQTQMKGLKWCVRLKLNWEPSLKSGPGHVKHCSFHNLEDLNATTKMQVENWHMHHCQWKVKFNSWGRAQQHRTPAQQCDYSFLTSPLSTDGELWGLPSRVWKQIVCLFFFLSVHTHRPQQVIALIWVPLYIDKPWLLY